MPTARKAHLVKQRKGRDPQISRDGVLEESLERFGKRDEYGKRVREWRKERDELRVKQDEDKNARRMQRN